MFSTLMVWLRSWFVKSLDSYNLFSPRQREIYSYFDGQKVVSVDPMPLYKRVMDHFADIAIDFKVAASESKDATKAWNSAVSRVREIFAVKSLEDGGLTERETVDLYNHFWDFVQTVKKNSPNSRTSRVEESPISASPTTVYPTTPNTSDSGLTERDSKTGTPESLPEASVSPTVTTQDLNTTAQIATATVKPD